MKTFETNWEVITESTKKRSPAHEGKLVYLTANDPKAKNRYSTLNVSAELAEEACLMAGDRYDLLRDPDDPARFCIHQNKVGLRTFKQAKGAKFLYTTDYLMVGSMRPDKNGTEFVVDVVKPNGDIIIHARKE